MNAAPLQIPLDWAEPAPPSFENFVVGDNAELVTALYQIASGEQLSPVTLFWSGASAGKTHLLKSVKNALLAQQKKVFWIEADSSCDADPFAAWDAVLIDDVDALGDAAQDLAFKAFIQVGACGGLVIATGSAPPTVWSIRDDLRTRILSGLTYELRAPRAEDIPGFVREHAERHGFSLSEEVLTYILNHETRDLAHLASVVTELDRWSLASKRRVTIALARAYLAHKHGTNPTVFE
ncbi:MAG: hypothetical protein EAZ21_05525 [Betaproteobacteria bacterium]|nr:MAG: hypothetical protein EAZ21_05525 [Betaproteobacteria bacterium]